MYQERITDVEKVAFLQTDARGSFGILQNIKVLFAGSGLLECFFIKSLMLCFDILKRTYKKLNRTSVALIVFCPLFEVSKPGG